MGTIIESFGNLNDYLLAEIQRVPRSGSDLILNKVLRPLLPDSLHCGFGTITDIKDRPVGPFDVVGCLENYPAFGDGAAKTYLADGAVFCLQMRNWAESDLTQFAEAAAQLKKLERKKKEPIPCIAVSFIPMPLPEIAQFMQSQAGQAVDGLFCVGQHVMLRNTGAWYGDPERVPFVTERPGPEALKAFSFFLLEITHKALGLPFGLSDYQHL